MHLQAPAPFGDKVAVPREPSKRRLHRTLHLAEELRGEASEAGLWALPRRNHRQAAQEGLQEPCAMQPLQQPQLVVPQPLRPDSLPELRLCAVEYPGDVALPLAVEDLAAEKGVGIFAVLV